VKLAMVLLLAIILVTIWVTSRKKSAPTTEPPLHPSTLVCVGASYFPSQKCSF
jgi:hypothetical protein